MQSLAHQFLTFCRAKAPERKYDYMNLEGCALYQFLKKAGFPVLRAAGTYWRDTEHKEHELPHILQDHAEGGGGAISRQPWTFGALADRLEACLAEQQL